MTIRTLRLAALTSVCAFALAACGETAKQSVEAGMGPNPNILSPVKTLIPTVKVFEAAGWPPGAMPTPAPGLKVAAFASGLEHPRWLLALPNGDVLVAETNAPPKPEDGKGLKAKVQGFLMRKAGAGVKSPNRIVLLRDANGDGVAETKTTFLSNLNSPFGMALVGDTLFVADSDAILRFPYVAGQTTISAAPVKVTDLPAGPRNHHWTKNIIASADGTKLYATVGSNSNVAENGLPAEEGRAMIWEVDIATGAKRPFATGLRNPNGMGWMGGQLWTVVNERDELGSDLVPDYLTSVKRGAHYGWPWSYYGQHVDTRVKPQNPEMVAKAIPPDYALGPHTASLGLTFNYGTGLPGYEGGAFVGQHGSWNRKPPSGYKVIFVPFANGTPAGPSKDVLTGFLVGDKALGRPVGVTIDTKGALLVADDVGNTIWRVTPG